MWLPDGVWYNFFDNTTYQGNKTITVNADIYEFPLFAKGGILIPMHEYLDRMTSKSLDKLVLRYFLGAEG